MAKKLSDIVEDEEVEPALRDDTFVHSPVGLYPSPIGRSTKFSAITKIKSKFRFLGKLLAKSTMDCRMVRSKNEIIYVYCRVIFCFLNLQSNLVISINIQSRQKKPCLNLSLYKAAMLSGNCVKLTIEFISTKNTIFALVFFYVEKRRKYQVRPSLRFKVAYFHFIYYSQILFCWQT